MPTLDINSAFADHILTGVNTVLPRLPTVLFDLLLGILAIRIIVRVGGFMMRVTSVQPAMRDVIMSIIETILWIFLSITLLKELGFSGLIYFFTGSVAAVGIAMAAGGSTLVADIVAGVFLARDADFNVGDEVIIVTDIPTSGVIESMDARRTRLRDSKGILHVIPNSVIERREWVLVTKRPESGALEKAAQAARRIRDVARKKRPIAESKSAKV